MKRVFSFVLALVMCLSLCACGGKTSKQADAPSVPDPASVPVLDLDAYTALLEEDADQADEEYEGKYYRYTGKIVIIEDNHCILGYWILGYLSGIYDCRHEIKIQLDDADLEQLQVGQTYTFFGQLEHGESLPEFRDAMLITE